MRIRKICFLVLFILASVTIYGQKKAPRHTLTDSLTGTWYLTYNNRVTMDTLVYSRTTKVPFNWGDRIELTSNYDFIDAYTAGCGNDSNIHEYTGTWEFDPTTKVLVTSIPVSYDHNSKHKIIRFTGDTLVIKQIH